MRNLLRANSSRLWRSRIFWAAALVMMGISAYNVGSGFYSMSNSSFVVRMDTMLFATESILGIAAAALVPLFLGVEYSDGTIRNKLSVGHRRPDIYLANLITGGVSILVLYMGNVAVALALGLALLEPSATAAAEIMKNFALGFAVSLCFAAVFTLMAMLLSNKSTSIVLSLLLAFGLFLGGIYVGNKLNQPEFLYTEAETVETAAGDVETTIEVEGETIGLTRVPNPDYISGTKRQIFSFLYDVNPSSQAGQLAGIEVVHPVRVVLYDAVIVLLTVLAGTAMFRRKDVR